MQLHLNVQLGLKFNICVCATIFIISTTNETTLLLWNKANIQKNDLCDNPNELLKSIVVVRSTLVFRLLIL